MDNKKALKRKHFRCVKCGRRTASTVPAIITKGLCGTCRDLMSGKVKPLKETVASLVARVETFDKRLKQLEVAVG